MTIPAICQQLAACCGSPAPYIDGDEVRCRTCSRSISFPTTTPDALLMAEEGGRANGNPTAKVDAPIMISCIRCRIELSAVRGECPGCGQIVVVWKSGTIRGGATYILPPFTPPALLRCSCCEQMLPALSFTVRNHESAKNRQYRASICRPCKAFRLRVRREQNPEAARARDRQRGEKFRAENPGYFNQSKTPAQREDNRLAVARLAARQSGKPVMRQRPGRLAVLQKPICRVFESCPLRQYCTVEQKGLV